VAVPQGRTENEYKSCSAENLATSSEWSQGGARARLEVGTHAPQRSLTHCGSSDHSQPSKRLATLQLGGLSLIRGGRSELLLLSLAEGTKKEFRL